MKRIHTLKRTIALFLAMLMAATSTAFADWDSYQGNNDNNGTTDIAITSTSPTSTTVTLPNNGASTGLDVEPLVVGSRIYAFHNGGSNGATVTAVSATDGSQLWTRVVGPKANNISQVATPAITTDGTTMYGAYTYTQAITTTASFTEDIEVGGTANVTFSFTLPHDYNSIQIYTGLSNTDWEAHPNTSLVATATIKDGSTTVAEIDTSYSYQNQGFSLYYSGYTFKANTAYTVLVSLTNQTVNKVTWTGGNINMILNYWEMFKVSNIDGNNPAVTSLVDSANSTVVGGYGQVSTPFTLADNNVYFGIYDGDHAYYQIDVSGTAADEAGRPLVTVAQFTPEGVGFYGAGALVINGKVIFGSESGILYMQSTNDFATPGISLTLPDAGRIRSSICYDKEERTGAEYLYLTSYDGFLWKISLTDSGFGTYNHMSVAQGTIKNTVSTPVVAKSGLVYVSVYGYGDNFVGKGYIVATNRSNISMSHTANIVYGGDHKGEMIQCSPVVYTEANNTDYIYFTSNMPNGSGYCYKCQYASDSATCQWSVTPSSDGNGYAVQGFAMGMYYDALLTPISFSVFGNDASQLIIVK